MRSSRRAFGGRRSGQGIVEVVLIIALIAIGLIGVTLVLRNSVGKAVNGTATQLDGHPTTP